MLEKQTLQCPECEIEFEFDPLDDDSDDAVLYEGYILRLNQIKEVNAYLECPNGHTKPYKVKKIY